MDDRAARTVAGFVERSGLGRARSIQALPGGVSSDIWRVELPRGPICVKRALPRLRVEQVWEAPVERNRYERSWLQYAASFVPDSAPAVLSWDDDEGMFAMQFLDHPVWKERLRRGDADAVFAGKVGTTLARIHAHTARQEKVARDFPTDAIFHAIRLEPYLLATAKKHPDLEAKLEGLVKRTADTHLCLVHGDVSPKNILVSPHGPVFLDAECAWYGDPAFDLAFCLNHLVLKSFWVPGAPFRQCFEALASAYLSGVTWESAIEERVATLLPALMLARVDGKSPVEYLDETQRSTVRELARKMLASEQGKIAWPRSST